MHQRRNVMSREKLKLRSFFTDENDNNNKKKITSHECSQPGLLQHSTLSLHYINQSGPNRFDHTSQVRYDLRLWLNVLHGLYRYPTAYFIPSSVRTTLPTPKAPLSSLIFLSGLLPLPSITTTLRC